MTKNFEDTIISLLRSIDKRMDGIDGRMGGIDSRMGGIDGRMDGIAGDIAELKTSYSRLGKKVGLVIEILASHSEKFKEHDKLFGEIITGVIPEMEKRTEQGIKLKNHKRRIISLESA